MKSDFPYEGLEIDFYNQYENLINKFAWKYANGICNFEEMKAHGNFIFIDTLRRFDKHKASFSTYLYIRLNYGLKRYFDKQAKECWPTLDDSISV